MDARGTPSDRSAAAGTEPGRVDVVRFLRERGVRAARFFGPEADATGRVFVLAGGVLAGSGSEGGVVDVWLADSFVLGQSSASSPDVVVEGCLPVDHSAETGLVPILVEVDRVALRSFDGATHRRIDFVQGGVTVAPIEPVSLARLDAWMATGDAGGYRLVARVADTAGTPPSSSMPAHLSWFRHTSAEPDGTSASS